jgi:beta-glucosidase
MAILEHLKDVDYPEAAKIAAQADVAIVFVNANSGEEFITVEGHKGDRNHLQLWNNGDELVKTYTNKTKYNY